jgi:hypothetical protein
MDLAQPPVFGKGAGCDLAMDTCTNFMSKNPWQNYYCPAPRENSEPQSCQLSLSHQFLF